MSKISDLLATEGEAAEQVPTPSDGYRRNLNRSVMFSVRFNPDELDDLQRYAEQRGLPARTLARSWILDRLRHESSQHGSSGDLTDRVQRLEDAVFRHTA